MLTCVQEYRNKINSLCRNGVGKGFSYARLMKTISKGNPIKNFSPLQRQYIVIYTKFSPCYTHIRLIEIFIGQGILEEIAI